MYPDLQEDNNNPQNSQNPNYQATQQSQQQEKKKTDNGETCCILGAKIWVTIIGILSMVKSVRKLLCDSKITCCFVVWQLLGLFVAAIALYAKFGYSSYKELSQSLPDGGIWMIFGFGIVLAIASIVLMLSAKFYENACFKMILIVFTIILTLMLLLEIVGAGLFIWALGVVTIPETEVGNAITDRILEARDAGAKVLWEECCRPEYVNGTVTNLDPNSADPTCLWPTVATAVIDKCDGADPMLCVCSTPLQYGSSFGLFFSSNTKWVAIVTIVFAVLLLLGIIATCSLICAKKKKKSAMYSN